MTASWGASGPRRGPERGPIEASLEGPASPGIEAGSSPAQTADFVGPEPDKTAIVPW